ncbi:TauD/TfdA family dioxygenase [Streptomyces sp. NPDC048419]|uniref:TauD/TfdA family dioxygenase n=1 Tax=Streptomyces sp. NPDC048419 TaxID=3365547 RepID=UPI0037128378
MNEHPVTLYSLNASEASQIRHVLMEAEAAGGDPGSESFYDFAWEFVSRLPVGFRRFLSDFRLYESAAGLVVRGMEIDDTAMGPTPAGWRKAAGAQAARREEIFLALVATCLGEVFNWATIQGGRMIQDVLPVQGEEDRQSGHGSVELLWHTEDGFHPSRCAYVILLGIRNHGAVPTLLSSVRDVRLPDWCAKVLFEERFFIYPDDEHLVQLARQFPDHPALEVMQRMRAAPEPVAVLWGEPSAPYLRLDVPFMRCADEEAEKALAVLVAELDRCRVDVAVRAGDLLIIDNDIAVHGRANFSPRFDGKDRWLKKAQVTRDLRAARTPGVGAGSRVLF